MTYRTRRRLNRRGTVLGIGLIVGVVIWICWLSWLGRFVVYSPQGAEIHLD